MENMKKYGFILGVGLLGACTAFTLFSAGNKNGAANLLNRPNSASAISFNERNFEFRNSDAEVFHGQTLNNSTVFARFDKGADGTVTTADNKATLNVTEAGSEGDWCAGMFIKTDITMVQGMWYKVSIGIESRGESDFQVVIQRSQWEEHEIHVIENPSVGITEYAFTADSDSVGELWLYVRSGSHTNTITVNEVSVRNRYVFTSNCTENGLEMHVTDGAYDDWMFGLVDFGFPTTNGQTYDCSFTLTVDSYGDDVSDDKQYNYSVVALEIDGDYENKAFKKDFTKDVEFTITKSFTATKDATAINLQLGAIRSSIGGRDFTVTVRSFVLAQGSDVVNEINFQSGASWKTAWQGLRTTHSGELCDNGAVLEENDLRELICDYYNLTPAERDSIKDEEDVTGFTYGQSVEYFREMLNL